MSLPGLRRILGLSAFALSASVAASGMAMRATPAPRRRRVSGQARFTIDPTPGCASPLGLCTTGMISGDLQGTIAGAARQFTVPADVSAPSVGAYINQIVIRTAAGELQGVEVGGADTAGTGSFAGLCAITGGTGQFAGATGSLTFRGTFTPADGGAYHYEGMLLQS